MPCPFAPFSPPITSRKLETRQFGTQDGFEMKMDQKDTGTQVNNSVTILHECK